MQRPLCWSMRSTKKKVIFIGGLSNGKEVVSFLKKKKINLQLIFTQKKKNISRYRNFNEFNKYTKVIKTDNVNNYYSKINRLKPDLILVAGWSGIIKKQILGIPKYGVIGFHPSDLPRDRGRSVLAWQIEEGYTKTALSMFFFTEKVDAGDIIGKYKIIIKKTENIKDILDRMDIATIKLLKKYFNQFFSNKIKRKKQDLSKATFRKLRDYKNQLIDWNNKGEKIINKIRALTRPYPGAIGIIGNKKYKIWNAKKINFKDDKKNYFLKKCKNCYIVLLNYEIVK